MIQPEVTQVLRSPKENRTNKYSIYHDEEHTETKHHTQADIHSTTTTSSFLPVPRSSKMTTEINRYIQRNTQNRGNKQQNDDLPVMQETVASKEYYLPKLPQEKRPYIGI